MKWTILSLVCFSILFSCKEDEEPAYCSEIIELGDFSTDIELPYDTFQYIQIINGNSGNGGLSINHPQVIDGASLSKHRNTTLEYTTDCEALQSVEKYNWSITEMQSVILATIDDAPILLIKALPKVNEQAPSEGPVGIYFDFFEKEAGGLISAESFMSVMVEEIISGEGGKMEKGHQKIDSIEIVGQTFTDVITNTEELGHGLKNIYFTIDEGVVGLKDSQGAFWRINE